MKKNDIRQFSLAWRWTQPTHAVLPDSVLAQLIPLDADAAKQLDERLRSSFEGLNLRRKLFFFMQEHNASEPSSSFLVGLGINDGTTVLLSWDSENALRTTWGIFRKYWDDFCYPGSDDLAIAPDDESWLLFYMHEEIFEFGKRKKAYPIRIDTT